MFTKRLTLLLAILSLSFRGSESVEYINVALGKPTQHISTFMNRDALYAVDGTTGAVVHESCTHTANAENNFWVVDLLSSYQIHSINIYNRDVMSENLQDFYIYASGINPLPIPSSDGEMIGQLCVAHAGIVPPGGPYTLTCDQDTIGRYVYLWKPANGYLIICEFEVIVEKAELEMRKESYRVSRDVKSSQSPFYSTTVEHPKLLECIRICLSAPGGSATIVQMNKTSKKCECIQESGLMGFSPDIPTAGWNLMKSLRN